MGRLGFAVTGVVTFLAVATAFNQLWRYLPALPNRFTSPPPLIVGRHCAETCTTFAISYLGGLAPTVGAGLLLALSYRYLSRQSAPGKAFLLAACGVSSILSIAQEWGGPFSLSLPDALTILFPLFLWLGFGGRSGLSLRDVPRILVVFSVVEFVFLAGDLGDWVSAFVVPPTQPMLLVGARGIYDGLVLLPLLAVAAYVVSILCVEILRVLYYGTKRSYARTKVP